MRILPIVVLAAGCGTPSTEKSTTSAAAPRSGTSRTTPADEPRLGIDPDRCTGQDNALEAQTVALAAADIVADVAVVQLADEVATAEVKDVIAGKHLQPGTTIEITLGPECAGDRIVRVGERYLMFLYAPAGSDRYVVTNRYAGVHGVDGLSTDRSDVEEWLKEDAYPRTGWKTRSDGLATRLVAATERKKLGKAMEWALLVRNTSPVPYPLGSRECTVTIRTQQRAPTRIAVTAHTQAGATPLLPGAVRVFGFELHDAPLGEVSVSCDHFGGDGTAVTTHSVQLTP